MTMRIVQEEEVIDLVTLFKANRARLRAALVACLLVPVLAAGVVALHRSALSIWVATVMGVLSAYGVHQVLRRIREVNAMIANPYWQQVGVRSRIQQVLDEKNAQRNSYRVIVGGK